ncbi:MAG: hypothetical protein ACRD3N_05080 [Terracidiphilus sp.]
MRGVSFREPARGRTVPADARAANGNSVSQKSPAPNLSVWFDPNLGTADDSFAFDTANLFGTGNPLDQFAYGQSINAGSIFVDGNGTVSFSPLTAPEGGAPLLYLLLAAAVCGGAMFGSSRSRTRAGASA